MGTPHLPLMSRSYQDGDEREWDFGRIMQETMLHKTIRQMKKVLILLLFFVTLQFTAVAVAPYYEMGQIDDAMDAVEARMTKQLNDGGFQVFGKYNPGNNEKLAVIAFTNETLLEMAPSAVERGAIASMLKVGLLADGNKVRVILLNPMYLFHAVFRSHMADEAFADVVDTVAQQAMRALHIEGSEPLAMGGDLEIKKLWKYNYMIGMAKFDTPVVLNEFESFEAGVETIRKNLEAGVGQSVCVYEKVWGDKKVAVFGVGMLNPSDGEAHFLPIIGESHAAAMPYEIVLENRKATMLHGRYRFALHWPELTMGTFTKIMSTPGDVKRLMKAVTQ